jgi:hypothetical protein
MTKATHSHDFGALRPGDVLINRWDASDRRVFAHALGLGRRSCVDTEGRVVYFRNVRIDLEGRE